MYASLVQDQGPITEPAPAPQQFDSRTSLPRGDLRRERTTRRPRLARIFPTPTDASAAPSAGLVGPLGASSLSLPTVERTLAEMEGGLGRRAGAGAPTSTSPILGSVPSPTQHEVLQKFIKSLLNPKDRPASPWSDTLAVIA